MEGADAIVVSKIVSENREVEVVSVWPDRKCASLCSDGFANGELVRFNVIDFFGSVLKNIPPSSSRQISFYQSPGNGDFEVAFPIADIYKDSKLLRSMFGDYIAAEIFKVLGRKP